MQNNIKRHYLVTDYNYDKYSYNYDTVTMMVVMVHVLMVSNATQCTHT